ncbi:MAG: iron-sulfur cluster carrier protein ApbC [Rhodospirillales bacterium]
MAGVNEQVNEQQVRDALRAIKDGGADIVGSGMLSGVAVRGGHVSVTLNVDPARGAALEPLRQAAEQAVAALPGVLSATAVLTAERASPQQARGGHDHDHGHGHDHAGHSHGPAPAAAAGRAAAPAAGPAAPRKMEIPGIKHIIAVASGKGGVGKSTTAVNLALGMAVGGKKIGLLDADIYGPSIPRMMGINRRPESRDGKILIPLENWGIRCMSIGFLVGEDTPMIWRGPMVISALQQMLNDVAWGELDALVVDLPPGTGDAQLTMAQRVPLSGAVIVSTPQDIALIDARKGLNMFTKVAVPVLGIIENMSYFLCPHCGERSEIFGHGGARAEATKLRVPFLGEVPLHLDIRTTSDEGTPIVASKPDSPHAAIYRDIAARVWQQLAAEGKAKPKILVQ